MPKMYEFLHSNAPWDLLIKLNNITLHQINADVPIQLNSRIIITPILVPHREEYTETVGYTIKGPNKSVLYIPDIDKWKDLDDWGIKIENLIAKVDVAFLDGTFYQNGEIAGRSMYDIPHPFIEESLQRFGTLPTKEKEKIFFIHFNHTNPVLHDNVQTINKIKKAGFQLAEELQMISL